MASGEVIGCRTYEGLCPHLQGLWNYACESFKLLSRTAVYDPFWSLISQDARVQVECDPLIERTEYRRYYKTAKGFSGRNCEMFLGQFVSLIARERVPAKRLLSPPVNWSSGTLSKTTISPRVGLVAIWKGTYTS